jgi:hypothetical protein
MMLSANTDPELRGWLRWAAESGNTPMLVRMVAKAARMTCLLDCCQVRPRFDAHRQLFQAGAVGRSPQI